MDLNTACASRWVVWENLDFFFAPEQMSTRGSRICLMVYGVLLVLSFFLLSVPGDYWPWYAIMVPFSVVPLCFGPRRYRVTGGIAFVLTGLLIIGDIHAGKIHRQKMQRIRAAWADEKDAPDGAASESKQVRSETNPSSAAAGSGR
jgi:hypothetical protein